MKKDHRKVLLMIITGLFVISPISQVASYGRDYSFPYDDYSTGDVACMINNKWERNDEQPSIDIVSVHNNITTSEIELELLGKPILDRVREYIVYINWNGIFNWSHIWTMELKSWELAVPPTANVTLCFAGGIKEFGITNGSYTRVCNNTGTPIFTELNNNTVSLRGNTLIFPFTQSLITTPLKPVDCLIVTTYNTTEIISTGNATQTVKATWIDSTDDNYIVNLYDLGGPLNTQISTGVIIGLFLVVGTLEVIYLRRKK